MTGAAPAPRRPRKPADELSIKLTPAEAVTLRNLCRAYEFLPIHRKVGPEAERLAIKIRELVDADPSIVAAASAES